MKDSFGREIGYLRLSITERCGLKCGYCRADEGLCPKDIELSAEDFCKIISAAAKLGIDKIRITGGEPLLRRDVCDIVRFAAARVREVALTTNGQMLEPLAKDLKKAGLARVNVSLDSLLPERFERMTGGGELQKTLDGIEAALEAGLTPVKINTVLVRGENDGEIDALIALTKDRPIDVRFIELMPIGSLGRDGTKRVSSGEIAAARPYLAACEPRSGSQPSRDYSIAGHMGRVGFIRAVSEPFCEACDRIRITGDGKLRPCLGSNLEFSLREALSKGEAAIVDGIKQAILAKPRGHDFCSGFVSDRDMSGIGG